MSSIRPTSSAEPADEPAVVLMPNQHQDAPVAPPTAPSAAAVGVSILEDRRKRNLTAIPQHQGPAGAVVEIDNASKTFGSVEALGSLTLNVAQGQITVLLGPNGAGKTTAIRMITGALTPDQGQVQVFDRDPSGPDGEEVRRRCGVVSAKPSLYDRLDGFDNLRYAAQLYGLGRGPDVDKTIVEAAERFGIAGDLKQQVGGYSTGMKTRLALARAVLHQPTLLLLDEPTSGLDPESAVAVLGMVREMTADNKTVLMCTHLLLEAEHLADKIVVMDKGNDLLAGHPDELANRFWPYPTVEITAAEGDTLDLIRSNEGVIDYQRHDRTAVIRFDSSERTPGVVAQLTAAGAAIESVVPYQPSLEDLYFAIRRQYGQLDEDWMSAAADQNQMSTNGNRSPRP